MASIEIPVKDHCFLFNEDELARIMYDDPVFRQLTYQIDTRPLLQDLLMSFSVFESRGKFDSILEEIVDTTTETVQFNKLMACVYTAQDRLERYVRSYIKDDECQFWIQDWSHDCAVVICPDPLYIPIDCSIRRTNRELRHLGFSKQLRNRQPMGRYRRSY